MQMRKKVKDLRLVDARKANSVSAKADEVAKLSKDIVVLFDELSAKPEDNVSEMSVFIAQYSHSNPNVLISDLVHALGNNGYPTDWLRINRDQVFDFPTFVSVIICSEKQGKRNAETL